MYFHVYLIYRFTRTFTDHSSVITRCWGFELQNGKSSLKSPQTLATQDFAPASFLSTPDNSERTSSFGCPFSFARSELATRHRRATPVSGFRRKPETGALPRKRGASSATGGAAPLSTYARSAYSIRGEAGFLRMAIVLTSSISLRFVCCQTFAHFAARPLPTETAPLGFGGDPAFMGYREAGSSLVARSGSETSCLTRIPACGEVS